MVAKLFHHSSAALSYINCSSTRARCSVCFRANLPQKSSFVNLEAICSHVSVYCGGVGLQAGLMVNYGMSVTSLLLTHTFSCAPFFHLVLSNAPVAELQRSCPFVLIYIFKNPKVIHFSFIDRCRF